MFIDEEKIRRKSKSLSGGFKGIVPNFDSGKRKTSFDWLRMIIGVMLIACMLAGTVILFYTVLTRGRGAVMFIHSNATSSSSRVYPNSDSGKKVEYLEVIYKPKQK